MKTKALALTGTSLNSAYVRFLISTFEFYLSQIHLYFLGIRRIGANSGGRVNRL